MVNNGGNIAKLANELSDERHAALITSDISRRYLRIHIIGGNYTCHKGSKLSPD